MNELLDADFNESQFQHHAFYNTEIRRIEMHLVSDGPQTVQCSGESLKFEPGETIHSESSYKYSQQDLTELVAAAGLNIEMSWHDENDDFGVHYLQQV